MHIRTVHCVVQTLVVLMMLMGALLPIFSLRKGCRSSIAARSLEVVYGVYEHTADTSLFFIEFCNTVYLRALAIIRRCYSSECMCARSPKTSQLLSDQG